jgi:replicative DNA helicase
MRFARELQADARALVDLSLRRRVARLSEDTASRADDLSVPLDTLLTTGADAFSSLHRSAPQLHEGQDLFREVIEEVESARGGTLTTCIPTGIEAIDEQIAGMALAEITFFLSQPGVGKSTVLGSLVRNVARKAAWTVQRNEEEAKYGGEPKPVDDIGIFSKEDLGTWIPRRMLAEASGIPLFVLQKGFIREPFTKQQMQRFEEAAGEVYALSDHYVVDDRNMLTVDQIIQSAREMKRQRERRGRKMRLFVLDHIGKVDHQIAKHGGKEDLAISHTLNRLAQFAKQEKVAWAIAVHGKERDAGAKYVKPTMNSAARTAYFERDARIMLGFYLDKDDDGVILGTVLKQTNGPPDGDFTLYRNKYAAMLYNREEEARHAARPGRNHEA